MNSYNPFIKYAEKEVDYVQINRIKNEFNRVQFENNEIASFSVNSNTKFIVKVWINGREGFSFGNELTRELIKKAIKIAKINEKKEYFFGLPSKTSFKKKSFQDKKLLKLSPETILNYTTDLINDVKDDFVIVSNGSVFSDQEFLRVVNSNGTDAESSIARFNVYVSAVSKDKKSNYWDSRIEPFFFKLGNLGKSVNKKVHDFRKAKPLSDFKIDFNNTPLIFETESFSRLLQEAFLENLNGYNCEKKKSIFVDKLNENVLSDISLIDDGTMERGVNSSSFDFEGTKTKRTTLFEKGVLKNFIYDYNTAKNNNKQSTGNASLLGIDFTNIILQGPYEKIDKAIVIDSLMGTHTANSLTTDFSVSVEKAYYKEKDRLVPLKPFMISGKMIEFMNNIISVDKKVEQKNGVYSGAVACKGVKIIF